MNMPEGAADFPKVELARFASAFGAIRVLERSHDHAREYWQGEALHTLAYKTGESLFGHIHAIDHLVAAARSILILGGAGGSLATMCARRGAQATVVDIEPLAEPIARTFFGLPPRVCWIVADGAAFAAASPQLFDAVVIDAFNGRGDAPVHGDLEQIRDLMALVSPTGLLLANFAGIDGPPPDAWPLTCALRGLGYASALLRADFGDEGNEILALRHAGPPPSLDRLTASDRPPSTREYLRSLRVMTPHS